MFFPMAAVLAISARAQVPVPAVKPIGIEWDAPAPGDPVESYRLYRLVDGVWTQQLSVAGAVVTCEVPREAGKHAYYVTAVSADGLESEPSNVLEFTVPKTRVLKLQASVDLVNWSTLAETVVDDKPAEFFRVAIGEPK